MSARSTIPGPPPAGVSSTVRWRSVARRGCSHLQPPASFLSARPVSECRAAGEHLRKRVRTRAVQGGHGPAGVEPAERFRHGIGARPHGRVDLLRHRVGQEVGDPDDAGGVGAGNDLDGGVVVGGGEALDRPDEAHGCIVEGHDRLAHGDAVRERHDPAPARAGATTKPGTSRVCSAPMSRIASQT